MLLHAGLTAHRLSVHVQCCPRRSTAGAQLGRNTGLPKSTQSDSLTPEEEDFYTQFLSQKAAKRKAAIQEAKRRSRYDPLAPQPQRAGHVAQPAPAAAAPSSATAGGGPPKEVSRIGPTLPLTKPAPASPQLPPTPAQPPISVTTSKQAAPRPNPRQASGSDDEDDFDLAELGHLDAIAQRLRGSDKIPMLQLPSEGSSQSLGRTSATPSRPQQVVPSNSRRRLGSNLPRQSAVGVLPQGGRPGSQAESGRAGSQRLVRRTAAATRVPRRKTSALDDPELLDRLQQLLDADSDSDDEDNGIEKMVNMDDIDWDALEAYDTFEKQLAATSTPLPPPRLLPISSSRQQQQQQQQQAPLLPKPALFPKGMDAVPEPTPSSAPLAPSRSDTTLSNENATAQLLQPLATAAAAAADDVHGPKAHPLISGPQAPPSARPEGLPSIQPTTSTGSSLAAAPAATAPATPPATKAATHPPAAGDEAPGMELEQLLQLLDEADGRLSSQGGGSSSSRAAGQQQGLLGSSPSRGPGSGGQGAGPRTRAGEADAEGVEGVEEVDWALLEKLLLGENWQQRELQGLATGPGSSSPEAGLQQAGEGEGEGGEQEEEEEGEAWQDEVTCLLLGLVLMGHKRYCSTVPAATDSSTSSSSSALPAPTTAVGVDTSAASQPHSLTLTSGPAPPNPSQSGAGGGDGIESTAGGKRGGPSQQHFEPLLPEDLSEEARAAAVWQAPWMLLVQDDSPGAMLEYANSKALEALGIPSFEDVSDLSAFDVVAPEEEHQQEWMWASAAVDERAGVAVIPKLHFRRRPVAPGGQPGVVVARNVVLFRFNSLEDEPIGLACLVRDFDIM